MEAELQTLRQDLAQKVEAYDKEKAQLLQEVQGLVAKSSQEAQEKSGLKLDLEKLQDQLVESNKVCYNFVATFNVDEVQGDQTKRLKIANKL